MIDCGTTTLVERVQHNGGQKAWTELVRRYRRVVFGYARGKGLNASDAEDFTQEILAELVRVLPNLELDRERGTFRSFLFTMVRRRLIDRHRAPRPHVTQSERFDWREVEPPDASWEQEWRRSLLRMALDYAARAVEPRTYQAFQLVVINGWTPKRAAEFLDLSVDGMYQAKARVLRHAREVAATVDEADIRHYAQ